MIVGFLAAGLFSVWTHSYQPFFNVYTGGPWQNSITGYPVEVDSRLSPYFETSYSQLVAGQNRACGLQSDMVEKVILPSTVAFQPINKSTPINIFSASQFNIEQIAEAQFSGDVVGLNRQPLILSGYLINSQGAIIKTCERPLILLTPAEGMSKNQELEVVITSVKGSQTALRPGLLEPNQPHQIELEQLPYDFNQIRAIEVNLVTRDN